MQAATPKAAMDNGSNDGHIPATLRDVPIPDTWDKKIDLINQADILTVCERIARDKPQTARRVRIVCSQVFEYAIEQGKLRHNPAPKSIDKHLITRNTPKPQNRKALHYLDVRAALDKMLGGPSDLISKSAYLFTVLTGARHGEVRKARWSELELRDSDNPIWRVPAARMKARHEHVVPLSPQAMSLLDAMRLFSDDADDFVFPSVTSKYGHLSDTTFRGMTRTAGLDTTTHGYRSSFRTWAEEQTRYSRLAMELSLAHVAGDSVERAYRRTTVLRERRSLMTEWANYILPIETLTPFLSD